MKKFEEWYQNIKPAKNGIGFEELARSAWSAALAEARKRMEGLSRYNSYQMVDNGPLVLYDDVLNWMNDEKV